MVGSSPAMEGTWFNPSTGDSFTVRDTYIEGDEFYIIATDGRRFNSDMIQNYIQSESGEVPKGVKPEVDVTQDKIDITAGLDDDLKQELASTQLPENPLDRQLPSAPARPAAQAAPQKPLDEDELFVNRLLSRGEAPKVKVSIDWKKYPTKQMEMLTDYMGVDVEKICSYYINKIDLNAIREQIQIEICEFIAKKQAGESEEEKPKKK